MSSSSWARVVDPVHRRSSRCRGRKLHRSAHGRAHRAAGRCWRGWMLESGIRYFSEVIHPAASAVGQALSRDDARHSAQRSHHHAGCPPSWYSSSTPSGTRACDVVLAERRRLAGDAGEQLGAVDQLAEGRRERRGRVAPGHQLAAGVAHGVAGREAALDVVAGGGSHAADAQRVGRARPPRRRCPPRGLPGSKDSSAARPSCGAVVGTTRAPASPTARPPARPPGSRSGCSAARRPRRRARVDPGQQLVGRGVHRRPAVHHQRAELLVEPLHAVAAGHRHHRAGGARRLGLARRAARCGRPPARACRPRRSATPRPRARTAPTAASGLVGVHVHAEGAVVAHDQHRVAQLAPARARRRARRGPRR